MKRENIKKRSKKLKRAEIIFMIVMLFVPMFYHILNTYVLGFYNLFFTFQRYDGDGNLFWVGLDNFRIAWQLITGGETSLVAVGLRRSILVWCIQNVVMFPVTMILCLYLANRKPGTQFFKFIFMIPTMMTGLIVAQVFIAFVEDPLPQFVDLVSDKGFIYFIQDPSKAFGTLLTFMLWSGFGSIMIVYPNAMNAIDKNMVEASQIDGATHLQQLWHVYLPGIWPTITVIYFGAFGSLFTADLPNFMFYGYNAPVETYTLGYYIFKQTMGGGDNIAPVLNALSYMISFVAIPLTMGWKYIAENYGPSEDEVKYKKKKLVDIYENR